MCQVNYKFMSPISHKLDNSHKLMPWSHNLGSVKSMEKEESTCRSPAFCYLLIFYASYTGKTAFLYRYELDIIEPFVLCFLNLNSRGLEHRTVWGIIYHKSNVFVFSGLLHKSTKFSN
jgi:hypothetical protein